MAGKSSSGQRVRLGIVSYILSGWCWSALLIPHNTMAAKPVSGAAEHNIIRKALSEQQTLNNLGFALNKSYDFSQQPQPAQPLADFQDNTTLQNSAAQHIQSCTFQHVSNQYGQNLFAGTGTSWTIEHAVNSWANEARHYDYQSGSCTAGEQCGHYTQIVWANTSAVGCVLQACAEMTDQSGNLLFGGRSGMMIFCHYNPPGNVVLQKPYPKAAETPPTNLRVSVKALLQGAYRAANHLMTATLSLPVQEPYSALGHTLSGVQQLDSSLLQNSGPNAVVDWLLLELRDGNNPAQIMASRALLVQRDGDLIDPQTGSELLMFADQPAGDYHLAVRHRNHLGVMTRLPLSLSADVTAVDFSAATTPVWGKNARIALDGKQLLRGGDANHDGQIIAAGVGNDVTVLLQAVLSEPANENYAANYIVQGYHHEDLNLDNQVIGMGINNDINLLYSNVLLHPANTTLSRNLIIQQQLP